MKKLLAFFAVVLCMNVIVPVSAYEPYYKVIFKGNTNTSGTMSSVVYDIDTEYALPANQYKKKGYSFTGWNTASDGSGLCYEDKAVVANLTDQSKIYLYAQWNKNTYTVNYDLNGGYFKDTVTSNTKYRMSQNGDEWVSTYTITSSDWTLPKPTRTGYTFKGWYKSEDWKTKVTSVKKGTTGNKTYYARWSKNTYTIAYSKNGATSGSMSSTSCKYNSSCTLRTNAYKRKGYTFVGWGLVKTAEEPYSSEALAIQAEIDLIQQQKELTDQQVNTIKTVLEEKVDEWKDYKDAYNVAYDSYAQAVKDKKALEKKLTAKEEELDEAREIMQQAERIVELVRQTGVLDEQLLETLQERKQEAYAQVKLGSLGYFQSHLGTELDKDARDAIAVLNGTSSRYSGSSSKRDKYESYTKLGASDDSTSLKNMKKGIELVMRCNEYRLAGDENYSPRSALKISDYMMAVSQVQNNTGAYIITHSYMYSVGENLAWGYVDPFEGWYDEELVNYEKGSGQTGHYRNMMKSSYIVSGGAVSQNGVKYSGRVFEQSFATTDSDKARTAEAYYEDFMEYYNRTYDAYNDARQVLEDVEAALAENVTDLQVAQLYLERVTEIYEETQDELDTMDASLEDLTWRVDSLSNEKDSLKQLMDDSREAMDDVQGEYAIVLSEQEEYQKAIRSLEKEKSAAMADFGNKEVVKNLAASGKVYLYARWHKNTYTITYDLNGGSFTADKLLSDSYHMTNADGKYVSRYQVTTEDWSLPKPVKDGYTFAGWYTSESGSTKWKTKVSKIYKGTTGSKTYYAKWTKN